MYWQFEKDYLWNDTINVERGYVLDGEQDDYSLTVISQLTGINMKRNS